MFSYSSSTAASPPLLEFHAAKIINMYKQHNKLSLFHRKLSLKTAFQALSIQQFSFSSYEFCPHKNSLLLFFVFANEHTWINGSWFLIYHRGTEYTEFFYAIIFWGCRVWRLKASGDTETSAAKTLCLQCRLAFSSTISLCGIKTLCTLCLCGLRYEIEEDITR